jgi:cysteine desulfurase
VAQARCITHLYSNLTKVVQLTRNFTSEAPLSRAVLEAIFATFEDGWADPKKLSQASSKARQLRQQSLEAIASAIGLTADCIEPLGEPNLGYLLAINGFLTPESTLITTTVDVGKARAVARAFTGSQESWGVDQNGAVIAGSLPSSPTVLLLQTSNGETGVAQDIAQLALELRNEDHLIIDATQSIDSLNEYSTRSSAVIGNASSWGGPAGLGFIAINNRPKFRYPLPHIAPISAPGSYSLPLLVGAALALELHSPDASIENRLTAASKLSELPGVNVIAPQSPSPYLSFLIDGYAAEEVQRELSALDIAIDAGSACSPENLAPSHVIAAMEYPTTGHMRATFRSDSNIDYLVTSLAEVLRKLSS